ncbi:hypothetical protein C8R45DRAFT_766923, partial [Mycena sanguinolenta]
RTGNLTHPDNVFCSENFFDFFVSCDAYPERTPRTTDHFPIISEIDLILPVRGREKRWDWKGTDWEEFVKVLEEEWAAMEDADGYASLEEVLGALRRMDKAVWRCVEQKVRKMKVCARSKRWWTAELSEFRKKERLARISYRHWDILTSPIHEQYRVARNTF